MKARGTEERTMRDAPRTVVLKLSNWRDFTKALFILSKDTWLYRGQEDSEWRLQSSLEREMDERPIDDPQELERDNIELFRANSKLLGFNFDSDIETLVAMQHHEAKTRLLDFSTSLMVALFFAYEKTYKEAKSRAIYAINFKALCESDTLRTRYQMYAKQRAMRRLLDDVIKMERMRYTLVEDVEFRRFILHAANDAIKNGNGEDGVLPLYTAPMNKRQLAQAGTQLMPLSFGPFVNNLAAALRIGNTKEINSPSYVVKDISHRHIDNVPSHIALIKMVFDKSMEKDAWDILDQSNINPFTIYPDLIGLAKSMRYVKQFV